MSARILIVDDEEIVIRSCLRILDGDEFQVESVRDGREALSKVEENSYDVMILDVMMPNIDGLEVLRRVKETHPNVDVIMITGLSQIDTAVQAMKLGAFDYISKPFEPDELKLVVQRALERRRLLQENLTLKSEVSSKYRFENIIGLSPQMQAVYRLIAQCAPTSSTVLITGESGTGKELIARAIHNLSGRRDRTFVKLNCAAIPTGLLESELFGHEKGAFTGAISQKVGRVELADHGTLFLDEVGDIPPELQPKLLRVLQEREFERLGSTRTLRVNLRLIAATNRDLAKMVADREFRSDLFYRLNVFPIQLPALRERGKDIPMLVRYFAQKHAENQGKQIERIPAETMQALERWHWPGNVRELENLIERAVILTRGTVLNVPLAELKPGPEAAAAADDVATLEDAERDHILKALREARGLISGPQGAAARLGLKRTTLNSKMRKLGISRKDYS
ncbi:MAG: sigma-54-dependent transcriptional regulator [Terriglobales bacterium]